MGKILCADVGIIKESEYIRRMPLFSIHTIHGFGVVVVLFLPATNSIRNVYYRDFHFLFRIVLDLQNLGGASFIYGLNEEHHIVGLFRYNVN